MRKFSHWQYAKSAIPDLHEVLLQSMNGADPLVESFLTFLTSVCQARYLYYRT